MIRGLLRKKVGYEANASRELSKVGVLEEEKKERMTDLDEIYGLINSVLSIATMKSMHNAQIKKEIEDAPVEYRIEKGSLFDRIFGDPYKFYKRTLTGPDKEVDYTQFLIDKYIKQYGE